VAAQARAASATHSDGGRSVYWRKAWTSAPSLGCSKSSPGGLPRPQPPAWRAYHWLGHADVGGPGQGAPLASPPARTRPILSKDQGSSQTPGMRQRYPLHPKTPRQEAFLACIGTLFCLEMSSSSPAMSPYRVEAAQDTPSQGSVVYGHC